MGVNLRIVSIATIYIETILFCQALGGWPAIEWILRNSLHYYDDKCTSLGLEVPCDVQDKAYVRLYSLTYVSLNLNKVIGGLVLDFYGMWAARCFSAVFVTLGLTLMCFTYTAPANVWLVWAGLFFYVGYGTSISFLNLNFTNMYPNIQGLLISLIAGSVGTSQFLYTIVKRLIENETGFEFWMFWAILLCCTPFIWIRTFLWSPCYMIPKNVPDHYEIGWKSRKQTEFKLNQKRERSNTIESIKSGAKSMKSINALKMIFSVPNCLIYVWFLFMDIRLTSFSSQYQTWLRWVVVGVDGNITAEAENTISQWTDTLNIVNLSGVVTGPLLGLLLVDLPRRLVLKRRNDVKFATLTATTFSMIIVTLCSIGLSFLACVQSPIEIHWLTIIFDFIIRAMLYVVRNMMLIILNPDEFFGRVMGIANAVAIVTGFLMPPFSELIRGPFGGNFVIFEVIFGVIMTVLLAVPGYFVWYLKSGSFTSNGLKNGDNFNRLEDEVKDEVKNE